MKKALGNLALVLGSLVFFFLSAEVALRFLPVSSGIDTIPIRAEDPIFRVRPNSTFLYAHGWNFEILNAGEVNAQGFISDFDYDREVTSPLVAVIGDSFVEALMVPFEETLHGRLAEQVHPVGRVYSFGFSGAQLPQYLAWAEHASRVYAPDAIAFVIIGNDFDESLWRFKRRPGYHHYVAEGDTMRLHFLEYQPSAIKELTRKSAFIRYLRFNVQVTGLMRRLRERNEAEQLTDAGREVPFVASKPAVVGPEREELSKKAVDQFLSDLPRRVDLPKDRILFVVDTPRQGVYEPRLRNELARSFAGRMFSYFTEQARARGYEVVDMHPRFVRHYAENGQRFEFPTDSHWNGVGHGVAASAVADSGVFEQVFGAAALR